jgi:hypothetical protein
MIGRKNPRLDAEWIMNAIVDDFAQSLDAPERALFYARLAELAVKRCKDEEREDFDAEAPGEIQ